MIYTLLFNVVLVFAFYGIKVKLCAFVGTVLISVYFFYREAPFHIANIIGGNVRY